MYVYYNENSTELLDRFTADPRLQLQVLEGFLRYSRESRGIFKTVDENRELLMCLQKRAPDLLEKCPVALASHAPGLENFLLRICMVTT